MKGKNISASLYFMAFAASVAAFVIRHQWIWLPVAAAWLLLGIFYLIKNKNDKSL